ncbi:McrB family protein [Streptococcus infantis]|uniref:McrB family protein n=1 Tax=Streptococcus infantis TaxID=68892 RepID=UPI0024804E03|nr:AAA family ATPase [Streptococcus infantis]MDH9149444.1 AAA family ATPase [Streptococcus infantis]
MRVKDIVHELKKEYKDLLKEKGIQLSDLERRISKDKKEVETKKTYWISVSGEDLNCKLPFFRFTSFARAAYNDMPKLANYLVIIVFTSNIIDKDSYSVIKSNQAERFISKIENSESNFYFENKCGRSHFFRIIDDANNERLDEVKKFLEDFQFEGNSYIMGDTDKEKKEIDDTLCTLSSVNTILYGPPGTGKTYKSIRYAVNTIDTKFNQNSSKVDEDYVKRFNEFKDSGQIAFTTFHQSYGYEEFIEGIKPSLGQDTENEGSENVLYTLNDGVFKEFCLRAQEVVVDKELTGISPNAQIWKVSVSDSVKDDCFESNRVRINFSLGDRSKSVEYFNHSIQKGDIILMTPQSRTLVTGIGIVTDEEAYEIKENTGITARNVEWLARDISIDIKDYSNGKQMVRNTVSRVHIVTVKDILTIIKNNSEIYKNVEIPQKNDKKYVFIIDEINRGNISKIFGELITLIEDSKRDGEKEAISITLPYSKEEFSVPNNVYILGTMNTADRSIALMDTALRRRFEFIEMMPNEELLTDIVIDGIEVKKMLETMNRRIEALYDREHTLGHAFFMPLKNEKKATINQLASIFTNKIIPLLQEYFYEDYEKIMLVLGIDSQNEDDSKFISVKNNDGIFKNSQNIDLNPVYQINKEAFQKPDNYITIYNGTLNLGEVDETKGSDS